MVTHGTNWRIAAEQMVAPLHISSVHDGADDLPLHKLVLGGELALRFLPDANRCGEQVAELASCGKNRVDCMPR